MSLNNEEAKALFGHLVVTLATSALQHMGKVMNPVTRKTEMNLDAAQSVIDMIDMLEAKTKGNLDAGEARLIKTTLTDLKLNFVETSNSAPAAPPAAQETTTPAAETPAGNDADADEKRKFHKKYD